MRQWTKANGLFIALDDGYDPMTFVTHLGQDSSTHSDASRPRWTCHYGRNPERSVRLLTGPDGIAKVCWSVGRRQLRGGERALELERLQGCGHRGGTTAGCAQAICRWRRNWQAWPSPLGRAFGSAAVLPFAGSASPMRGLDQLGGGQAR